MPGPSTLSTFEIDKASIRLTVQSGLAANGWTGTSAVPVKLARNGFPVAEEITLPSVYVELDESQVAGWDLGSHGKSRLVFVHIFAKNDGMKERLAEEITNFFRDGTVQPLAFVTGAETSPASTGFYAVDSVGWRSIPMPAQATDADRWRARVRAELRRDDA